MDNDIRKLIDDNWDEIKELIAKKTEAEQKPKTIWDLKKGDEEQYYRLYNNGTIVLTTFESSIDRLFRYMGSAFLTKEEAELERERRKIGAVMRRYSRPFADGKINYFIVYDRDSKTIGINYYWSIDCGVPCFETKEIAQQVIDKIGKDRLEKYWFGVKE